MNIEDSGHYGFSNDSDADPDLFGITQHRAATAGYFGRGGLVVLRDSTFADNGDGVWGDGVLITDPAAEVRVENVDLSGNGRVGLLLHGGTGVVSGGSVTGNALAIVQQDCDGLVPLQVDSTVISGNGDDTVHLCDLTVDLPP